MLLLFNDLIKNTQYFKEINNFELVIFNIWFNKILCFKIYRFINFIIFSSIEIKITKQSNCWNYCDKSII